MFRIKLNPLDPEINSLDFGFPFIIVTKPVISPGKSEGTNSMYAPA